MVSRQRVTHCISPEKHTVVAPVLALKLLLNADFRFLKKEWFLGCTPPRPRFKENIASKTDWQKGSALNNSVICGRPSLRSYLIGWEQAKTKSPSRGKRSSVADQSQSLPATRYLIYFYCTSHSSFTPQRGSWNSHRATQAKCHCGGVYSSWFILIRRNRTAKPSGRARLSSTRRRKHKKKIAQH